MVAWSKDGMLRKYDTTDEIIDEFCGVRYEYYIKRKKYQLVNLENELRILRNKVRFITEVMDGSLKIMNIEEDVVSKSMEEKGYDKEEDTYDYLLRLQVRTFTKSQVVKMKQETDNKQIELDTLKNLAETDMWLKDLEKFELEYDLFVKDMADPSNGKKKGAKKGRKKA